MTMEENKNTQNSVETRLQKPLTVFIDKDVIFKDIFGDMEEWIFEEADYRFMLNPLNRRWLFWDRFHDGWEDTGYYAGEVTFVLDGNKIFTSKASSSTSGLDYEAGAKVIVVNGSAQDSPVFVNTLIGNERNCDIKIKDTDSKALILQHTGGYTFFAMAEKDPIFINNKAVPPEGVLLHDGDRITIARTQFDFVQISQPDGKNTEKEQSTSEPNPTERSPGHTTGAECHSCHADLEDNVKFCTSCGTKVIDKPVTLTCPGCGSEISEGLKFCTNCGQKF